MKIKILLLIFTFLSISCKNDNGKGNDNKSISANQTVSKKQDLNVSILLDLSDRIDPKKNSKPSMEFYKRDLGYILSISKAFENHLRSKPIKQDDDQIQIYFEPEPLNSEINNLSKKLKLSFTKDNTTKDAILKISPSYNSTANTIYNLAIKDEKFVGSDIWGFFKNNVNDYCIKPNHRNILFILTDGYMFHKDSKFNYGTKSSYLTSALIKSLKLNTPAYQELIQKKEYGFIKANDNLNNLEVFVLGINPVKGNPFEGDVIKLYWNTWLKEMKVKSSIVKLTDLPSNLDPIIQKYINP
jgi:hypothetical protein